MFPHQCQPRQWADGFISLLTLSSTSGSSYNSPLILNAVVVWSPSWFFLSIIFRRSSSNSFTGGMTRLASVDTLRYARITLNAARLWTDNSRFGHSLSPLKTKLVLRRVVVSILPPISEERVLFDSSPIHLLTADTAVDALLTTFVSNKDTEVFHFTYLYFISM